MTGIFDDFAPFPEGRLDVDGTGLVSVVVIELGAVDKEEEVIGD